jgi:hypothetical protein
VIKIKVSLRVRLYLGLCYIRVMLYLGLGFVLVIRLSARIERLG